MEGSPTLQVSYLSVNVCTVLLTLCRTLTRNIRQRKGENQAINIPSKFVFDFYLCLVQALVGQFIKTRVLPVHLWTTSQLLMRLV